MIENVVFDIGGVLADFRMMDFLAEKGFDEAMARRIVRCAVTSPCWGQFERGEISEEEALAGFARQDPAIEAELRLAFGDLKGMLVPRDFAIPLLLRLKEAGYGVFYLSNYSRKAYDECADSLTFMPHMDGGLVSFQAGMTKPSPEFFELFLQRNALRAETCLFVDDSEANVEAARALGFQGITYTTYDALVEGLRQMGVNL